MQVHLHVNLQVQFMVCNVQCAVCCLPHMNIKQFKFIILNKRDAENFVFLGNFGFNFKNLITIGKYILCVNIYSRFGKSINTESA